MAHTKQEIIEIINWNGKNFKLETAKLVNEDIPILNELARAKNISVSSRAILALGMIKSTKTIKGIEYGVKAKDPILRISAAISLKGKCNKSLTKANISESVKISEMMNNLLSDEDVGVRKYALKSIGRRSMGNFKDTITELCENETNDALKKMAKDKLKKFEKSTKKS